MSRIVCVHGIAQDYMSRESLLAIWTPALCGGVSNAGGRLDPVDVDMAFYGTLFRPEGGSAGAKGASILDYAPGDLTDSLEIELLRDFYECSRDSNGENAMTKGGIARTVAGMLQTVAKTPFFGGVAQKVVIRYLKQVSKYVGDPATRAEARKAVIGVIRSDTTLLVGHSLGSVVAWEALCANPELPVRTFITIGSPLGVPALLSRLNPSVDTRPGPWPAGILRWVNIADGRDVVALEKCLARVFGSKVDDYFVDNGATMHDVSPYLTSREMGRAVTTALA